MASKIFRKAAGSTAVGVLWRVAVFLVVVLLFSMLMSLRDWYTSYAPSEKWANAVEQDLEWSPVISTAAKAMSLAEPNRTYPTEESFYRELLSYIRGTRPARQRAPEGYQELMKELDQHLAVKEYRELRQRRDGTEENLEKYIRPHDQEIVSKSDALRTKNEGIAAEYAKIEHLKGLQEKPPGYEEKIRTAEANLEKLLQRKPLFTEVQELITQRGTIEAGLQRALSNMNSRIKSQEEGIREAFDAAALPARQVNRFPPRLQTLAMQIGKKDDPLHVLYLMTWYGLEAAIVFLLCFVLVPWLIRLFGDGSDPNDVRSKITERVKGWLAKAFSPAVANSAGKVIAVAVAGSIAAAGVSVAAGDQPSIIPPIQHEGGVSETKDGQDKSDQKGTQKTGEEDKEEPPGGNSRHTVWIIQDDLPPGLLELPSKLEQQAQMIKYLEEKLNNFKVVSPNVEAVRDLNQKADEMLGKMKDMSTGVGSLTQDMRSLNGSIGGLYAANRSILQVSDSTNRYVLGSLNRLEWETIATKAAVDKAAQDVPPVASDLLRINAIPGGAWTRINPLRRYEVTEAVTRTVERAMLGVDTDQQEEVTAALRKLQDGNKRKYKKLKKELYARCSPSAHPTLDQWTPFIAKVSRVQE